jgi:signal peptidase I
MDIWIVTALLMAAAPMTGLAVARRLFVVVRVAGNSMLPAFGLQDRVLVRRGPGGRCTSGYWDRSR